MGKITVGMCTVGKERVGRLPTVTGTPDFVNHCPGARGQVLVRHGLVIDPYD